MPLQKHPPLIALVLLNFLTIENIQWRNEALNIPCKYNNTIIGSPNNSEPDSLGHELILLQHKFITNKLNASFNASSCWLAQ